MTSALIAAAALKAGHSHIQALSSDAEVSPALRSTLRPGDVLITMGAGDVAKFMDSLDRPSLDPRM